MPKRTSSYRSWQLGKLTDPRIAASYLKAAVDDSPEMFLKALGKVAQANQMTKVANESGVQRESLYRMFSKTGNPRYSSLSSVLTALGLKLSIEPLNTVHNSPE
jgi:probable addiction module antidote protein